MLGTLIRKAIRKGVLGGSRPWMAVGVAATVAAVVRKAVSKEPESVYKNKLEPGQGIVIRVREPAE